jgi:hypothetical protein
MSWDPSVCLRVISKAKSTNCEVKPSRVIRHVIMELVLHGLIVRLHSQGLCGECHGFTDNEYACGCPSWSWERTTSRQNIGQTSRTPIFWPEGRVRRPLNEAGPGYALITSTEIRDSMKTIHGTPSWIWLNRRGRRKWQVTWFAT